MRAAGRSLTGTFPDLTASQQKSAKGCRTPSPGDGPSSDSTLGLPLNFKYFWLGAHDAPLPKARLRQLGRALRSSYERRCVAAGVASSAWASRSNREPLPRGAGGSKGLVCAAHPRLISRPGYVWPGVKAAMEDKAALLVLDMETDGGRIDTTEEIIRILGQFQGETITYVNRKAFSAGAFISVATQRIYMAPQSVIGAAAPLLMIPGPGPTRCRYDGAKMTQA